MGNITVLLEVDNEIKQGLLDGTLKLFGSVVRDNKGRIVKRLNNGSLLSETSSVKSILSKKNVLTGIGVLLLFGSAVAFYNYKKKASVDEDEEIDELVVFNEALIKYIKLAMIGELSLETVQELNDACSSLLKLLENKNIVYIPDQESDKIVNLISNIGEYIGKLALEYGNDSEIDTCLENETMHDNIVDLMKYLKVQTDILEDRIV